MKVVLVLMRGFIWRQITFRIIIAFRKSYHMPRHKRIPPLTLTAVCQELSYVY